MTLDIEYENNSSRQIKLEDDFKWDRRDVMGNGNKKDTNVHALVHDLSINKGVSSYSLMSSSGKILTKWKKY